MAEKQVRKIDDLVMSISISDERSVILSVDHEKKAGIRKKAQVNIRRKSSSKVRGQTCYQKTNGLEER